MYLNDITMTSSRIDLNDDVYKELMKIQFERKLEKVEPTSINGICTQILNLALEDEEIRSLILEKINKSNEEASS